jgi:hypothetical protein
MRRNGMRRNGMRRNGMRRNTVSAEIIETRLIGARTNTQKNSEFEPQPNTFVSALPIAQYTYLVFCVVIASEDGLT